ncbi:MAG TPA: four helix bundle protein [Bacteroidales bacterium]|mgnify:CR=1 FL=1|nr:four helix bundle protein [Bacteroidales bacterium]
MDERKNINRGFKKLRVWQDAIELFVITNEILKELPWDIKKSKMNTLDAAHSILRNIGEGYCRRSAKEYLNFLNISLGSCGELNSAVISFHQAGYITDANFEQFDVQHYKTENALLKLASSIQKKITNNQIWNETYK